MEGGAGVEELNLTMHVGDGVLSGWDVVDGDLGHLDHCLEAGGGRQE